MALSFTGPLLKDLVVKPTLKRYGEFGMTAAATVVQGAKFETAALGAASRSRLTSTSILQR
jgi:hypothetical protein